jgi:hypothetical protein
MTGWAGFLRQFAGFADFRGQQIAARRLSLVRMKLP